MDDVDRLLSRVNPRITELRRALAHDHRDDVWWSARAITARRAQRDRQLLRQVAHLLHVERANRRGRIHCARFATLEAQGEWLAEWSERRCANAAELLGFDWDATLAMLRAGKLPL